MIKSYFLEERIRININLNMKYKQISAEIKHEI